MKKKQFALLSLTFALMMTASVGLGACTKTDDEDPDDVIDDNGGGGGGSTTATAHYSTDTRSNAYSAYSSKGTLLGSYKSVAAAINAAVAEDDDTQEFGSYVTKIGETTKIFTNRAGFTDTNDDMFWYYENGTMIDAMDCWQTDSIAILQNTDYITYEVSGYGTKALQSWNGYGLLDENGAEIATDVLQAQSWELSSTMDAAVIQLSGRLKGVSGLDYNIDLSDVKITPNYEGTDSTYAFMGFYSWQDYYVIAIGIACDTTTGVWYEFNATSRDDSFSDAEYNIGNPVMTSTWNENGGYYTPDCTSLSMSIRTTVQEDDEGEYQVNQLTIDFSDGTQFYKEIDQSTVNQFFSGAAIGYENAYVFIAGLDIVADVVSGVKTEEVDYTNGAKFENLKITSATAHIASQDELSETKYGYSYQADAGDYDILLASTGSKLERGIVYDYTILNTRACTTYTASNGCDVYSFCYDGDNVSSETYGSNARVYQNAIDELANVNSTNASSYASAILAVGLYYGDDAGGTNSSLNQRYRNVLDFTYYLAAVELLASSSMSEEASAVAAEFNTLSNILQYSIVGWTTDGDDIAGYLYSEVEKFRTLKAQYDALSSEDQAAFFYGVSETAWNTWVTLSEDLATLMADTAWTNSTISLYSDIKASTEYANYSLQDALYELLYYSLNIKNQGTWTAEENDDTNSAGTTYMCFDNHTYPSLRIIQVVEGFDALGVALPAFATDTLAEIGYDDFYYGAYYPIYYTAALAEKIATGTYTSLTDLTNDELAFLNEVWVSSYTLSNQISWNWNSGNKFEMYYSVRTYRITVMAGASSYTTCYEYFDCLAEFLENMGYEINANGWGVTASVIEATSNESDAAKAVAAAINALSDLSNYTYINWTTEDSSISGYLYSEVLAYRAAMEAYAALTGAEKIAVAGLITDNENYKAWGTLSDELEAYMDTAFQNATFETYSGNSYNPWHTAADVLGDQAKETLTAERVLAKALYYLNAIYTSGATAYSDDNFINAVIMQGYLDCLNTLGGTLPTWISDRLYASSVDYQKFYDDCYVSVYGTVQLGQRVIDGTLSALGDLTSDELTFLNTYWVYGYDLGAYSWQWNSGNHFKTYHDSRTAYIVRLAGGTLKAVTYGGTCITDDYFVLVGNFLKECGYTLNDNGWGITGSRITTIVLTEAALNVYNMYDAMYASDDVNAYLAWGSTDTWASSGYTGVTVKGNLYYEVQTYALIKSAYDALSADEQSALLSYMVMTETEWAAWLSGWADVATQVETMLTSLNGKTFETYSGNSYNPWHTAADVIGDQVKETLTGERVVAKFMYYLGDMIQTGGKAQSDDNFISAVIMQGYLDALTSVSGFTLPACLQTVLYTADLAYSDFYNQCYVSVYGTVQLANKILAGTVTSLSDLTSDELAFLNTYWVSGYDLGAYSWQWNSGNHFATYHDSRTAYIIRLAGGTITTVPSGSTATCVADYYFTVVGNFLVSQGYTLNDNGWGVTASTITVS